MGQTMKRDDLPTEKPLAQGLEQAASFGIEAAAQPACAQLPNEVEDCPDKNEQQQDDEQAPARRWR